MTELILVTGAGGMVGRHIRDIVQEDGLDTPARRYVWVDRADVDLRDRAAVEALFARVRPTHVIHCAARLAAASAMSAAPVDYWLDNVEANNNVLRAAAACGARVVSVLSSVMFAADAAYPVTGTPAQLYGGSLHPVSEAYGLAKRALGRLSSWYRAQSGARFSCVVPGNIFGPYGDFRPGSAPLLNALVAKAGASVEAGGPLGVMGTGAPRRQVLYARDLARVLLWAVDGFDDDAPLIVAGEEASVAELAQLAAAAAAEAAGGGAAPPRLEFDASCPDGPLTRTADTSRLAALMPGLKLTPLADAVRATTEWYAAARTGGDGGGGCRCAEGPKA